MIQFNAVTFYEVDMALKRPVIAAHGVIQSKRVLLLKWVSNVGVVWSEAGVLSEPTYHYETVDTVVMALKQWVLPLVLNKKYHHPSEVLLDMNRHIQGHFCAKATVEMAAWNVLSIYQNQSLAETLGGQSHYAVAGAVLGGGTFGEIVADAVQCVALGYRRIKVKLSPGQDVEMIHSLRQVIPAHIQLIGDANGSYVLEDIDRLLTVSRSGISILEQPFDSDHWEASQSLQGQIEIPLCLDESVHSIASAERVMALNACRGVAIKPGRLGGIGPSIAVYQRVQAMGGHALVGGMFETAIGRAYILALHSVIQDDWIGDLSPSGRYWMHDLGSSPDQLLDNGVLAINRSQIGSGVIPDEHLIHRLSATKEMIAK